MEKRKTNQKNLGPSEVVSFGSPMKDYLNEQVELQGKRHELREYLGITRQTLYKRVYRIGYVHVPYILNMIGKTLSDAAYGGNAPYPEEHGEWIVKRLEEKSLQEREDILGAVESMTDMWWTEEKLPGVIYRLTEVVKRQQLELKEDKEEEYEKLDERIIAVRRRKDKERRDAVSTPLLLEACERLRISAHYMMGYFGKDVSLYSRQPLVDDIYDLYTLLPEDRRVFLIKCLE